MPLLTRTGNRLFLVLCLALSVGIPPAAGAGTFSKLKIAVSDQVPIKSAAAHSLKQLLQALAVQPILDPHSTRFHNKALPRTGIVLAPVQQWQGQIPALAVLRLPFYYPDISAVHQAIDGKIGVRLASFAEKRGWKILAVWDDGMTDFSGNQNYSRLVNLRGKEFALWRPDPLQTTELQALNVWSRVIRKNGVQRNAQQCMVDSRSTTPTQMWREHLQRVHLDVTLTHDRYVGYVMAMPLREWQRLDATQGQQLQQAIQKLTPEERKQAAGQQQQALSRLHHAGMQIHTLSDAQRRNFVLRMPDWHRFFKDVDREVVEDLIAAAGTATAARGRN